MAESLTVNGVDLTANLALLVRTQSGLYSTPARRTKNLAIPGRDGELVVPGKRYGPGRIELQVDVTGVDPVTGQVPGGSTDIAEFRERVDELVRLFSAETLTIDHVVDGVTRRATGELADEPVVIDPIPAVQQFGEATFLITVPDCFWATTTTATATATLATGGTLGLSAFDSSTAPITDALITFGPQSNPTLTQGDRFVRYAGVIAAGRELTVDCATWTLGTGAGTSWTPDPALIQYGPGPSWFELDTTVSPLQAVLTHTGGGTAAVTFTARNKFLTS